MKRARHIPMRGWIVEEFRPSGWARIYHGLSRREAEFIAYGWGAKS